MSLNACSKHRRSAWAAVCLLVALFASQSSAGDYHVDAGLGVIGGSRSNPNYRGPGSAVGFNLGFGRSLDDAWQVDLRYSVVEVDWKSLSFPCCGLPTPPPVEDQLSSVTLSVSRRFESNEKSSAAWRVGIRRFGTGARISQSANAAVVGLELVRPLNEAISFRASVEISSYESSEIVLALRWHL